MYRLVNRVAKYLGRPANARTHFNLGGQMVKGEASGADTAANGTIAAGTSLAASIKFECERLGIPFTVDGIAEAFANAEIDDAPSNDAILNHIAGRTKLSAHAKGLNRKSLNAYGKLFKLQNPDSLQRPSHVADRLKEFAKPTSRVAVHAMAAKDADLDTAKQRLESLWGGPHQSLAFFLLDYLND